MINLNKIVHASIYILVEKRKQDLCSMLNYGLIIG